MNLFLAIDGGGSRTTCLAIRRDGAIVGAGNGGPSNHLLVEQEIVKHPSVLECVVIPAESVHTEQEVMAIVVPRPGMTVDRERSITWAPAGLTNPACTSTIRSPVIRIDIRSPTAVDVPSMSRPAWITFSTRVSF